MLQILIQDGSRNNRNGSPGVRCCKKLLTLTNSCYFVVQMFGIPMFTFLDIKALNDQSILRPAVP